MTDALIRVRRYLNARQTSIGANMDPDHIHGIGMRDEPEAHLTASDIDKLITALLAAEELADVMRRRIDRYGGTDGERAALAALRAAMEDTQ